MDPRLSLYSRLVIASSAAAWAAAAGGRSAGKLLGMRPVGPFKGVLALVAHGHDCAVHHAGRGVVPDPGVPGSNTINHRNPHGRRRKQAPVEQSNKPAQHSFADAYASFRLGKTR